MSTTKEIVSDERAKDHLKQLQDMVDRVNSLSGQRFGSTFFEVAYRLYNGILLDGMVRHARERGVIKHKEGDGWVVVTGNIQRISITQGSMWILVNGERIQGTLKDFTLEAR